jgi:hypothetical protein
MLVVWWMAVDKISKIKAVAEDLRGDKATREIAQRKLEELRKEFPDLVPRPHLVPRPLRFPDYYTDPTKWKKMKSGNYQLEFYMFKIVISKGDWDVREWSGRPSGYVLHKIVPLRLRNLSFEEIVQNIKLNMAAGMEDELIKRAKYEKIRRYDFELADRRIAEGKELIAKGTMKIREGEELKKAAEAKKAWYDSFEIED